jgi:hypothetical protein
MFGLLRFFGMSVRAQAAPAFTQAAIDDAMGQAMAGHFNPNVWNALTAAEQGNADLLRIYQIEETRLILSVVLDGKLA